MWNLPNHATLLLPVPMSIMCFDTEKCGKKMGSSCCSWVLHAGVSAARSWEVFCIATKLHPEWIGLSLQCCWISLLSVGFVTVTLIWAASRLCVSNLSTTDKINVTHTVIWTHTSTTTTKKIYDWLHFSAWIVWTSQRCLAMCCFTLCIKIVFWFLCRIILSMCSL